MRLSAFLTPNVQGEGREAALSRSVPSTAGLGLALWIGKQLMNGPEKRRALHREHEEVLALCRSEALRRA